MMRVLVTLLAIGVIAAAASAAEVETLITSWENTMDHFGSHDNGAAGYNFESVFFDTIDGVTNGTYSLGLDLKAGWQQGLQSTDYQTLQCDWQPFFPELAGATKIRIDVTTSNSLINIPYSSGIIMAVYMQGQTGAPGSSYFNGTSPYVLVNGVYSPTPTTETLEFILPFTVPSFTDETGGWFDMRIHFSCLDASNPGILFVDNLRAVKPEAIQNWLGDFNGNGEVEIADYTTWADHFGMAKSNLSAGSYVGLPTDMISIADYTTWADHFGADYDGPGVPEPATMSLLALGGLALLRRNRK